MRVSLRFLTIFAFSVSSLSAGSALQVFAQTAPAASTDSTAKAHAVLDAGLKMNALAGADLKPWHMKLEYTLTNWGQKPETGTMEEWSTGPNVWKRVYTGTGGGDTGSEWSVTRGEQYQASSPKDRLDHTKLDQHVARPVVNPLYQAANIKPDYDMALVQRNAGVMLNCVNVIKPSQYSGDIDPELLYPTACFDESSRLRLASSGLTIVQFSNIQMFQGHAVARGVKVSSRGTVQAEMKITLLEDMAPADAELVKPGKDAIPQPYVREPSDPDPVAVSQPAAAVPLTAEHVYYTGTKSIPVVIQKDGSVKVLPGSGDPAYDAVVLAVKKWKYQPYTVDGQVTELAMTIDYPLDMHPFIPEYERKPAAKIVTAPDDFSSAFDPKRLASSDLNMAVAQAKKEHKRILMILGGAPYAWSQYMEQFFASHADVKAYGEKSFVILKVYVGPANQNERFMAQFPSVSGYPHFFVIDSDMKLLATDNTDELRKGNDSYSPKDFKEFFDKWKGQ